MAGAPDISGFPSRNQIEKAGKYLRNVRSGRIMQAEVDTERYFRSIDIVTTFREAHGYPMGKVRMGLASMLRTEGLGDAALSQRHKRVPRIVRKLVRMDGTNLARLEDIGGCRVVVTNSTEMERICRRITKNWTSDFSRAPRDYVAQPKPMGYRARHFVVIRDDRAIEVQVRTIGQQRWADAVEAADTRLGFNLKDEDGPPSVVENFQLAAEVIYRQEWGEEVDDDLVERLRASNNRVIQEGYFTA